MKAMLVALEIRQLLGIPLYIQFEDDDAAPFADYYPQTKPQLLEMLDRPMPDAAAVERFMQQVDWDLTRRLWVGEGDYRSVEPVLRAVSLHVCNGATAIWQPLADEMQRRTGKSCNLLPPVVDCLRLRPEELSGAERRRMLGRLGIEPDRLVLFVSGTVYNFSDEFRLFLGAVGEIAKHQRIALLLAGRARLDVNREMAEHLPALVQTANLGTPAWRKYLKHVHLADVVCVPGVRDEFNRLRLPGRIPVAMALGKSVFTFEHGFGESLTDGREAILTHEDTVEHWARQLARLCDASLRGEVGRQARGFAEREFDAMAVAERLLAHLRQASQKPNDLSALAPLFDKLNQHWMRTGSAARMERATGIEPATSSLGSSRSTN